MNDHFDRAPGAGRARMPPISPALPDDARDIKPSFFNAREPLRQPKTSPPLPDNNLSSCNDGACGGNGGNGGNGDTSGPQQSAYSHSISENKGYYVDTLVKSSKLSVNAAVFVPTGFVINEDPAFHEDSESYGSEGSLADMVAEFLGHLSSSPGSFEADVDHITNMFNSWVTTEELLQELVELIFTQSTAIPNFSYTGTRLCNHLSHHLAFSPSSGNFRQLLLKRCQTEFQKREIAVQGDLETQKRFHSFVLFLGELYLNLELKSQKGPPNRANILLIALRDLLNTLFSHPVDANLICAVKLLKLTGSVLEDTWKQSEQSHMQDLVHKIENVVLDASCSRDVKQMLLKLVELRSSDWGRVHAAGSATYATPDNDPNYFMNEPTFYTADGVAFTAADPEYSEKYQEILDREDYFPELHEENGNEFYYDDDDEDEMDPEIEEAFENFCLESERKRQQRH